MKFKKNENGDYVTDGYIIINKKRNDFDDVDFGEWRALTTTTEEPDGAEWVEDFYTLRDAKAYLKNLVEKGA